jgi:transposase
LAVERVACAPLGVRIVQLVTDDPDAARCPVCRVVSTSGKDWVLTRPHDLPSGGGQIAVQWRKRRWRCRTVDCARATFTEQVAQVPAGMRTTTRLRTALAVAVQDGRDQSEVAAAHGVSWPTVQRAVVVHGAVELGEPEPTPVLGMDETRFGRPRWLPEGVHDGPGEDGRIRWVRTDPWETGFVDIAGDQALLGQVDGRTSAAVQAWLAARTPEFRAGVEVVVIDPHAGYAAAVRAALPDAVIAVELGRTRARCPGCPGSVSRVRPPSELGRRRGAPGWVPFPSACSRTGRASFPAPRSPVITVGFAWWPVQHGCPRGSGGRSPGSCGAAWPSGASM